jgi:hypothetical protein
MKVIMAQNPLRDTVTAEGPVNLDSMFEAGTALIDASANENEAEGAPEQGKGFHLAGATHAVAHLPCKRCGGSHQTVATKTHAHQAAMRLSRDSSKL